MQTGTDIIAAAGLVRPATPDYAGVKARPQKAPIPAMNCAHRSNDAVLARPIANLSFATMQASLLSAQRRGVTMMHTARPFSVYRKVFYGGKSSHSVLRQLQGKRVVDVGCGYTPFMRDSMFRACHDAGIAFYAVDPLLEEDMQFGLRQWLLARATGARGRFQRNAPGLSRALNARAQDLPFEDNSMDEILCSYLLFVWLKDEKLLAEVFAEFLRVLKPGGRVQLYPLHDWRNLSISDSALLTLLDSFTVEQCFVHGGLDPRIMPSMLTRLTKSGR